jgi:hypothetical protein
MTEASLYERLGGAFAIAAVVDHFSDAIVHNPIVGQNSDNPALREWHTNNLGRLPGPSHLITSAALISYSAPRTIAPSSSVMFSTRHFRVALHRFACNCHPARVAGPSTVTWTGVPGCAYRSYSSSMRCLNRAGSMLDPYWNKWVVPSGMSVPSVTS